MPITASLGALSYPRNLVVQAITTDKGFSAIVPGYQFIPGDVSALADPLTGYTTASYTTHGVDVDTDGNLYFCGVKAGLGVPSGIPPEFGIFKLDYTTGAPIYDSYPVSPGGFYPEGIGVATAVNSDDKVNFAGYYFTGFSPIIEYNRTYQVTSADLGTGYYQSGTSTNPNYDTFGIQTIGSNYYLCTGQELPAATLGILKINTSNVYQNGRGIRDNQNPVSSALNYRDFCVDSSENYYYLVNLSSGSLGAFKVLVKQNTSGTIVWAKSFNFEPLSFTVDSSGNVYTLVYQDQGSFSTFHIVKMNSSGTITSQNSYAAAGSNAMTIGNTRLRIGNDGYLYTQLAGGAISKWDTSLNHIWTNNISYIPSSGLYAGPIGAAGIVEYNGSVYFGQTVGYDGQEAMYVNRLPSDGSLVVPNKWWLGNGYGQYVAGSVTVRTPVATISVTDYIYLLSSSPSTVNSYEAANDPPSEDGLVINKQL